MTFRKLVYFPAEGGTAGPGWHWVYMTMDVSGTDTIPPRGWEIAP